MKENKNAKSIYISHELSVEPVPAIAGESGDRQRTAFTFAYFTKQIKNRNIKSEIVKWH